MKDPFDIIYHPYVTEKTSDNTEKYNTLEFIVKRTATKKEIKKAVEKMFDVKVMHVRTKVAKDGKHAIVRFPDEYKAIDIGMRIGLY
ncbi:MAG: 50S ribosomal protein L23 [Candidatus Thermoplasmatota archaeon]